MNLKRLLPQRWHSLVHEIAKFGTVGMINMVLNIAVLNLLMVTVLRGSEVKAKAIAVIIATISAYLMNRYWTYRNRRGVDLHREYALFFLFNLAGFVIEVSAVMLAKYGAHQTHIIVLNIANLAGIGLATVFRFWAYRTHVFRPTPAATVTGEPRTGTVRPGNVLAGTALSGKALPGNVVAGEVLAGEVLASDALTGRALTGRAVAGELTAAAGAIGRPAIAGNNSAPLVAPGWTLTNGDANAPARLMPVTVIATTTETAPSDVWSSIEQQLRLTDTLARPTRAQPTKHQPTKSQQATSQQATSQQATSQPGKSRPGKSLPNSALPQTTSGPSVTLDSDDLVAEIELDGIIALAEQPTSTKA